MGGSRDNRPLGWYPFLSIFLSRCRTAIVPARLSSRLRSCGLPKSIRRPLQGILLFVEAGFDRPFGARGNPLRYLGSLAFFFF